MSYHREHHYGHILVCNFPVEKMNKNALSISCTVIFIWLCLHEHVMAVPDISCLPYLIMLDKRCLFCL